MNRLLLGLAILLASVAVAHAYADGCAVSNTKREDKQ